MQQALSVSNRWNAACLKYSPEHDRAVQTLFLLLYSAFERFVHPSSEQWRVKFSFLSKDKHWSGTSPTTLKVTISTTAPPQEQGRHLRCPTLRLTTAASALLTQVLIGLYYNKDNRQSLRGGKEWNTQERVWGGCSSAVGGQSGYLPFVLPFLPLQTQKEAEKFDWHHFFFTFCLW